MKHHYTIQVIEKNHSLIIEKIKHIHRGGGGGGGGAKKSVWTPSSNTVELEERITNLLLKRGRREYHPTPLTFYNLFCFASDSHGIYTDRFLAMKGPKYNL